MEQLGKGNPELTVAIKKLTLEREEFKSRDGSGQIFLTCGLTQLQKELSKPRSEKEKCSNVFASWIKPKVILNGAIVSLKTFASRVNQSIEGNAILENKLDEEEDFLVTVQRLEDEIRDLHHELAITRRQPVDSASTEYGDDICLPKRTLGTGSPEIPV